jgi:acetyl-CoA carboxylase biotin carboxyl carrier protein
MQLDHDQLHKLLAILGESDIQELKLEGDDFRLEVRRNLPGAAPVAMPQAPVAVAAGPAAVAPQPLAATAPPQPPPAAASARTDLLEITAPMVATFYRSPTPDDPAFVEVGSRIGVGQTVCILEAMKLMNELESELAGEVVEILVENGTPVEYGQVLLRLRPL